MNTNSNKRFFIWFLSLFLVITANAQGEAYCREYEKEYQKAKAFFTEHKSKLEAAAQTCNLSAMFLFAIVAPELTQFSYLSNKIETYSLKVFYVQNGKAYSDFSIGVFQMKPSFIEAMENYINSDASLKSKYKKFIFKEPNERQARVERVDRLGSVEWQIEYLALFCAIVNHKFANTTFATEEEKLRFYANAYNSGFHRSEEALKTAKGAYFPHFSRQKYRYADISVWFYEGD
jgi:hypothetical protein